MKITDYPACVGLTRIGNSKLPWRQRRTECWTDMKERPYAWYLRFLPNSWIWYTRQGACLKVFAKRG